MARERVTDFDQSWVESNQAARLLTGLLVLVTVPLLVALVVQFGWLPILSIELAIVTWLGVRWWNQARPSLSADDIDPHWMWGGDAALGAQGWHDKRDFLRLAHRVIEKHWLLHGEERGDLGNVHHYLLVRDESRCDEEQWRRARAGEQGEEWTLWHI